MKRWLIVLACAAMLTALGAIGAVSVQQESQSGTYRVYFREADLRAADGGDALRAEERSLRDEGLSTQQLAELLVEELLHGPMDPTLVSPIPQGTILTAAEQLGTEIHIDLSSAYGTLSGVSLSLADYAITMTLSQLPDVARVRVTVRGSDLDYRSRQIFHARDVLLAPRRTWWAPWRCGCTSPMRRGGWRRRCGR